MGMKWTANQQKVIDLRRRNILVSAAAGSGKTAVLVERIINMITDKTHPVDIDRLLIVTFTNAAAAEMRERISAAIEKALEEKEADEHLERQLTLLHNAQITTIDSFCLYVVRNHFYEIDIEPNFRIGDEGELKLLREDVLKQVLDAHYENPDKEFSAFMEGYASGKSDAAATEMILELYNFSRSYPWPKQWLASCKKGYQITDSKELDEAAWMQPLVKHIRFLLSDLCKEMEQALAITREPDGPDMYEKAIQSDLDMYEAMCSISTFTGLYEALNKVRYERFGMRKGFDGSVEKQERVKALRESAKETIKKLVRQYCYATPQQMVEQLQKTEPMAEILIGLTEEFAEAYAAEKKKKNLVDFYDVEHFALEILVEEESGKAKKTAEEFRDSFTEIMIDEYQDSNYVQEAILTSISRMERGENNIFMVGDVKQSIYRFRLARPELFMEKYDTYPIEDSTSQRVDLHQNFRSRNEVLEVTNDVFYRIMGRDLGNVVYNKDAALYPGAIYPESTDMQPELLLTDAKDELLEDTEYTDKKLLEAKLVANRIRSLLQEQKVTDKKTGELRSAHYSDIVILLRSLNGWADAFAEVLNAEGIPAHAVSSTGYFGTVEVQTVLSMLRILDNPRQDIPLAGVLRSPIGNLSDEELAVLRLNNREIPFCACVLELCRQLETAVPKNAAEEKLFTFYKKYSFLRGKVADTPIHELIELVLKKTGYGNYVAAMPSGARRLANLDMLLEKAVAYEKTSYKGLFHFVRYIDELQKYDVDFGEADLIGENEDVVRIMSIHKSKGLEFPIVFVSGMGKNFNKQDVRSHMVLHAEFGIGLDAMDGTRRIKAPTIVKRAIAKQIELENLGEELRVLYVAFTRAKEKLILTGYGADMKEKVEEYALSVETMMLQENELLPYSCREGAVTYLDWLLPALLSYGEKYSISLIPAETLVTEEVERQMLIMEGKEERLQEIAQADETLVAEIADCFSKTYPYAVLSTQKNKYSVSELKHRAMREAFEAEEEDTIPIFIKEELVPYIPKFIREASLTEEKTGEAQAETINRGALRGTAVHRVMECYDFTTDVPAEEQVVGMVEKGLLTEELYRLVRIPIVKSFVASETGQRMKAASKRGQLYREKPFVMGFTGEQLENFGFQADSVITQAKEDLTLIQGIIDVFWIEEDGIVLLDYKTDAVETPKELVLRYEAQLHLYAEALNRVFADRGMKVKEKLIYAFRFGEIISIA